MKSKEVLKILNCSYTTLHNYVKQGKLKLSEKTGKQNDYDDLSVYELYDRISGTRKMNDRIDIFLKNQKYEFILSKDIISKVLDLINEEMKKELEFT